ncbi:hypothetical protein MTO96_032592 [Rhipicephalus appendiculatus]
MTQSQLQPVQVIQQSLPNHYLPQLYSQQQMLLPGNLAIQQHSMGALQGLNLQLQSKAHVDPTKQGGAGGTAWDNHYHPSRVHCERQPRWQGCDHQQCADAGDHQLPHDGHCGQAMPLHGTDDPQGHHGHGPRRLPTAVNQHEPADAGHQPPWGSSRDRASSQRPLKPSRWTLTRPSLSW